jgi:two-component system LytT family response regulator
MVASTSALIVDDEPLARERLRSLLQGDPSVEIVGECADGLAALAAIRTTQPDLVFLDIQLSGCDGLEVAAQLPPGQTPLVIFVTAHERYALEAFNVRAVDYLLKPFDRERLLQAVHRAKEQLDRLRAASPRPAGAATDGRIAFRVDGRVVFLKTADIHWIEAADNYVVLHLPSGRLMLRDTLTAVEARLDPAAFVRVNRSAVVQLDQVKELQPALHGDYTIILRDGTRVPLSRGQRAQLKRFVPGLG